MKGQAEKGKAGGNPVCIAVEPPLPLPLTPVQRDRMRHPAGLPAGAAAELGACTCPRAPPLAHPPLPLTRPTPPPTHLRRL